MTTYILLLAAHIICVIVWLGTTTTLALLAAYGTLRHDRELRDRLPVLARWFGPRVIGPSSLGTLVSGILLTVRGDAGFGDLWLVIAVCAFVAAALVSIGVRLPATLLRRRAGAAGRIADVERADRLLLQGSMVELAILYLAAAEMVLKPTAGDTAWLIGGAAILALVAARPLITVLLSPARLERRTS
jgi:uncharacterized membrane protein